MFRPRFGPIAALLALAMLSQGTWALAGTTGGVSGSVTDDSGAPIAGVKITVSAPSETTTTTSDASGHFSFLSLAPDSYTLALAKEGYNPATIAGLTVFADNTQTVALHMSKALTTIVKVASRSTGNLVKPGTTSDVYSVNAATQQILSGSGGGYNLNAAYSALYAQPGVTSYIGNYGWGQVFYIRGGSYSQTGYEFDGVPVNRAFDNYQANSLSSLGQQELQVYTGGSPSGASSATLGGFINQVIKTGTYPGFGAAELGIGAPSFYHQAKIEAGGASPDRLFSYYVGVNGYNQFYPYFTNKNMGDIAADGSSSYGFIAPSAGASLWGPLGAGAGDPASADGGVWPFQFTNGPFPACKADGSAPAGEAPQFVASPAALVPGGACNAFGPYGNGYTGNMFERNSVINLHFGVPHKNDGGKDDIQLLYNHGSVYSTYADSINDVGGLGMFANALSVWGGPTLAANACATWGLAAGVYNAGVCAPAGGPSPFPYDDGLIYGPGTQFGQSATGIAPTTYWFPNSNTNRVPYAGIPLNQRGGIFNDVAIVKAQYQKNIGSNAYARIYGYSFYSDWLQNNINEGTLYYGLAGYGSNANGDYPSPDYELETHTRGVSFEYANQINAQNLLRFTANYVTASLNRFNNQSFLGTGTAATSTNLVDAAGNCYRYSGAVGVIGTPNSCFSTTTSGTYGSPTRGNASGNACSFAPGTPACLAGASFVVTRPSGTGTTNGIVPKFTTLALEDEFRPNDKLDLNIGVRYERYQYDLVDSNNPMFNFWFNAASHVYCYDPGTGSPVFSIPSKVSPSAGGTAVTTPTLGQTGGKCYSDTAGLVPIMAPSGQQAVHPDGTNGHALFSAVSPSSLAHASFSPRLGGTYTLNANTVLRFSAGRYTQPTPAAFEQYLNQYGKSAASTDFTRFWILGFTNPSHDNPVQTSNNYDFSLEKRLNGTDITLKISPFYRDTSHQSVTVPLGPNFVSAVNLGHQFSKGVEFQIQKGDPTRDGLSGAISYTYTSAKIKYDSGPNGKNAIDTVNNYIAAFNKLTSAGGGSPFYCGKSTTPLPDGTNPGVASVAACTAIGGSAIANPYYSFSSQALLDRGALYDTYPNSPPEDPISGQTTAISPNVFAGWINWKHDKLSISPNFILLSGNKYGSPTDLEGVDPRVCDQSQGSSGAVPLADPNANAADYYTCGGTPFTANAHLAVPNPFNGNNFGSVGQYTEPWQLNIGAHATYDFSSKVKGVLDISNLWNRCFGGSKTPWSDAFPAGQHICGYTTNGGNWTGTVPGSGFFYGATPTSAANGTASFSKALLYPYAPFVGDLPVQAYFQLQIKL
jgi:hypothetical protein